MVPWSFWKEGGQILHEILPDVFVEFCCFVLFLLMGICRFL